MTVTQSLEVLELPSTCRDTLTVKQIKTAFNRLVRKVHSDVTGIQNNDSSARITALVEARGVLLSMLNNVCSRCRGTGLVRSKGNQFVSHSNCPQCDGTGEMV